MSVQTPDRLRCVVHPGRLAADECPRCGRLRCAADAAAGGVAWCLACRTSPASALGPRASRPDLATVTRAALGATVVAVPGALLASQNVGVAGFSLILPFLLGVVVAWAAEVAARPASGGSIRLVAAGYAVLASAYGFVLVPGGLSPFLPLTPLWSTRSVVWPHLAAVAGAWFWSRPPRPP